MIGWLGANAGTVLVFLILCGILALAVRTLIRDRQQGKSACGTCCGCAGCGHCTGCAAHAPEKSGAAKISRVPVNTR